jgi:rod shape-determining protein MreC
MPVVTGEGIVGQVYAASTGYSKVLLAIAPSSAIDVLLQDSRVRGILKGTGGDVYRLEYILKTIEVAEGDRVVTAGYGGMFPTGLPVGIVSDVTRKRRGMFLEIEVVPAVDFRTLENLLVIEREKKEFK